MSTQHFIRVEDLLALAVRLERRTWEESDMHPDVRRALRAVSSDISRMLAERRAPGAYCIVNDKRHEEGTDCCVQTECPYCKKPTWHEFDATWHSCPRCDYRDWNAP